LTTTVTLDVAAGEPCSTPATLTPDASATVAYALFRAGAALGSRVRKDMVEVVVDMCIECRVYRATNQISANALSTLERKNRNLIIS
jgi:hypothetical protein